MNAEVARGAEEPAGRLISAHHGRDWCHVCGSRSMKNAGIFYQENAEAAPDASNTEYLRICKQCAQAVIDVING